MNSGRDWKDNKDYHTDKLPQLGMCMGVLGFTHTDFIDISVSIV